jgi:hypothetical protein
VYATIMESAEDLYILVLEDLKAARGWRSGWRA